MPKKIIGASEKRSFIIRVSITGHASVTVEAENEEEAKKALWAGKGEDHLNEWEYDEIKNIEENT